MLNKDPYILWLPSWYPSKVDPYNGDFTQRQAMSVALFKKIIVLFIIHDPALKEHKVEVDESADGNLIEWRVYYPQNNNSLKIIKGAKYFLLLMKIFFIIKKKYGLPQIIHVNVIGKSAILALILKKIKNIPYLITENWTGYYSADPGGLHTKGYFMKWVYKAIFKNTSLFIPVSNDLGKQVRKLYPEIKYEIVPNTVDTSLFKNQNLKATTTIKRIIHVSTLSYQKNIEGLISIIKDLVKHRNDFELILIGPYSPEVKKEIDEDYILMKRVKLTGNIPYAEVGTYMKDSDFLVMFSRYENLPCVILEALCSGLPVISTSVGGIPEIINKDNGILIESENNNELKIALEYMLNNLPQYNRNEIAERAIEKYSYITIGQSINKIYEKYLLF